MMLETEVLKMQKESEETAFVLMYSLSYLWDQSSVKLVLFMLP